jgi:hypothetical protein
VYWANYLAEEEYILASGATRQYTIAPGCTGSRAGGRCNFAELLLYICKFQLQGVKSIRVYLPQRLEQSYIFTPFPLQYKRGKLISRFNFQGHQSLGLEILHDQQDGQALLLTH